MPDVEETVGNQELSRLGGAGITQAPAARRRTLRGVTARIKRVTARIKRVYAAVLGNRRRARGGHSTSRPNAAEEPPPAYDAKTAEEPLPPAHDARRLGGAAPTVLCAHWPRRAPNATGGAGARRGQSAQPSGNADRPQIGRPSAPVGRELIDRAFQFGNTCEDSVDAWMQYTYWDNQEESIY